MKRSSKKASSKSRKPGAKVKYMMGKGKPAKYMSRKHKPVKYMS